MDATQGDRSTAPRARPWRERLPGLLIAAVGCGAALAISAIGPAVGALTIAVILGILVGPFLPASGRPGLSWATRRFLRVGVVLLGLQLGLEQVVGLGLGTVVAVVAVVVLAFVGTLAIGRLLGLSRGLRLMVATGFSICGASAIAAVDSVTDADKSDVATAIALVTLYGSGAMLLLPFVGVELGLPPEQIGAWAGASVHEVAQVVAAASPVGAAAVGVAVVVKLTRVVLLAPLIAGVGLVERRRRPDAVTSRSPLVPLFVVGFLAMMVVRTSGMVPAGILSAAQTATTLLFAVALFGLGSTVSVRELLRTGHRALVLGGLATVLVGAAGLLASIPASP